MAFGARPLGSRTFGDGTGDSGFGTAAPVPPEAMSFAFTGTGDLNWTPTEFLAVAFTGSGAFDVEIRDAYGLWFSFGGQGTFGLALPPVGRRRRLLVTQSTGVPYAGEDLSATWESITWSLNEPDSFTVGTVSTSALAETVHAEKLREAQCWYGDTVATWGPLVRPVQDSSGVLTVQGQGADWHLRRRHIGSADRTNYMLNPSFEDFLSGWRTGYMSPVEGAAGRNPALVSNTHSSVRSITGRYSQRIELFSDALPAYGAGTVQSIVWSVGAASKDGDIWTVSMWVYIPSATLRSIDGAQLRVSRYSTVEFVDVYNVDGVYQGAFPKGIEAAAAEITPDTPLDQWTQLTATLTQPYTGIPEFVQLEFYAPRGVVFVDDARLSYNERMEFFSTDQATIIRSIVEHVQDPAYDKTNVNITTDMPATGITRDRRYEHADHENAWTSIGDFTNVRDGVDWSMLYTPTKRVAQTHFPAKGRWRPTRRLTLGQNIQSYSWAFEGDAANTSVIALGEGPESTREEGFATDASGFAEAVTLEEVFSPGPGTPIDALDGQADEWLEVTRSPETLRLKTFPASPLFGRVQVGDWCPVDIHDTYRIVRLTLSSDGSLDLDLNRREVLTA